MVQDKYVFQLESTFETNVPMPVVTIEPSHVDIIPYELGVEDTITFKITNHGLLRANNVRFSLPEGHPYLKFKTVIDDIGGIEANTTIMVPIKTTLKPRQKRIPVLGAYVYVLTLLSDYYCDGWKTIGIPVIFCPHGRIFTYAGSFTQRRV
ncbi:hypothetical protein DPMN_192033 [Dreissena polymorpha]|uniref:Uncharacterized protein n=1 Tax=Dreissena polymorpha TaxID=45954 RepID=A0A9D3Y3U0_DREPO|nr:hypothetical protein DPMN_192033 [Dreissena polymorpha]